LIDCKSTEKHFAIKKQARRYARNVGRCFFAIKIHIEFCRPTPLRAKFAIKKMPRLRSIVESRRGKWLLTSYFDSKIYLSKIHNNNTATIQKLGVVAWRDGLVLLVGMNCNVAAGRLGL
jgi:hypothetical protein